MDLIHIVEEDAHEEEVRLRYIWRLCDAYIGRLLSEAAVLEKTKELLPSLDSMQVAKLLETFQAMSQEDLHRMVRSFALTRAVVPLSEIATFRTQRDHAERDRLRVSEAQLDLVFNKPENPC